jgi:hypothetical protein
MNLWAIEQCGLVNGYEHTEENAASIFNIEASEFG